MPRRRKSFERTVSLSQELDRHEACHARSDRRLRRRRAPPHAQGKKKDWAPGQGIDWKGDWDAAVEEAAARNVPIHIAIHKDN
jgi:hypothetical protein